MGSTGTPIVHFDYAFSPYGQKTKLLLTAAGVPFERIDVSLVIPRKELEELGITYRRIPVLAVGKDVYCDSSLIFDVVLDTLAKGKLETSPTDKAWESWGFQAFYGALSLIPHAALSPDFVKDRETVFPIVARSDFKTLRPSGIAELQSRMEFLEKEVLAKSPFINGDKLSVADIHAIWGIRWALYSADPPGLGASGEAGVGKEQFPKVWKLIESLPQSAEKDVSAEEGLKKIRESSLSAKVEGVNSEDPTGIKEGTAVVLDSSDTKPHAHPQKGKLVSAGRKEIVIAVDNGLHLHFPREGVILREA